MTSSFRLLCLALLLLVGGWSVHAPEAADARPQHPKLRPVNQELRTKLHELAKWCVSPKLFGSRYDVYELILSMWPNDEVARKWNGYDDGGEAFPFPPLPLLPGLRPFPRQAAPHGPQPGSGNSPGESPRTPGTRGDYRRSRRRPPEATVLLE